MTLHTDIANIAGQNPAVYVGAETLSGVAFDTFRSQIMIMKGVHIPTVTDRFYAKLLFADTVGGESAKNIKFGLQQDGTAIYLAANGGLKLTVEYGAAEKITGTDTYSETALGKIEMLIKDMSVSISVTSEKIAVSPCNACFIPTIERDQNFDDICINLSLDLLLVSRVEGMIAYSGIQTIVASLLREPQVIDLTALFPGVVLLGQIEAVVTPNAEAVLIIPGSGVETRPGSLCDCAETNDGVGPTKPGTITTDGQIKLGGPTAGAINLGRLRPGIGETGFYMPIKLAVTITEGPPPITRTDVEQSGFICWEAQAVVDWKIRKTWFDTARGAVMVQWWAKPGAAFAVGSIKVDLGKLGKFGVADFIAKQQPSPATFTVALFPDAVAGMTTLHPVIEAIDMGEFFIEPSIISFVMAPFNGPAGVVWFITETIMYGTVAHNIPIELTRTLKKYLAGLSWKIQDLSYWGSKSHSITSNRPNPVVLWDATADSILISARFDD
ncbi:hypothetical protein [Pseudomonas mandelii]|uniref:hypothetical protein n=1 Tax=Pseudomonas mandelii TaxID=75612 RepID=UPI00209EF8E4|nr:hypothetical protein [Pseudomonas mandelii]MCO8310909.1 hypothetical protein [Pseudomonas mandelii]